MVLVLFYYAVEFIVLVAGCKASRTLRSFSVVGLRLRRISRDTTIFKPLRAIFLLLLVCPVAYGMEDVGGDAVSAFDRHPFVMTSAFIGDFEQVQTLVHDGASVQEPGRSGLFPLHVAVVGANLSCENRSTVLAKYIRVLTILLSHGADFACKSEDAYGDTIFHKCFSGIPWQKRSIISRAQFFEALLKTIFLTQGPTPRVFGRSTQEVILIEESGAFKRKVWHALQLKDVFGNRSIDLICNKGCFGGDHQDDCWVSAIDESYIDDIYDSTLQEMHPAVLREEILDPVPLDEVKDWAKS